MAPSAPDLPTPSVPEITENNLQPFFVLHGESCKRSNKNSNRTVKARRRIDLSPVLPKNGADIEMAEEDDDRQYLIRRMEAFEAVWSKIESTVKKNMEFIDDLVTFEELGLLLKSQGCHVAKPSFVGLLSEKWYWWLS